MSLSSAYFRQVKFVTDKTRNMQHTVYAFPRPALVLLDTKTKEPLVSIMVQAHGENLDYRGYISPDATKFANVAL